MSSRPLSDDVIKKFYKEVIDHVKESEELVAALRLNGHDPRALEQLARHLHSIKGTAPIMGAQPISTVARELEECVKALKDSPDGAQGPLLDKFLHALRVIHRQIEQFVNKVEMESGADAVDGLRSLMPATKLLESILKYLALNSPELSDALEENHRQRLKEALNGQRRVYSIHLSLPRSTFQIKLVEALKTIGAAGSALAYANTAQNPHQGFEQAMALLVVSDLSLPEFSQRLATLPVDIVEVGAPDHPGEDMPERKSDVRPVTTSGRAPGQHPPQKPRVLLVEDSDATRELYRMVLIANGFEVETAKDGEEALERLRSAPFNAVLSDDQMPVMDGSELLRAVKSDPTLRELPVIIMSGKGSEEDRSKAFAGGVTEYFVKGAFEKSALVAVLRKATQ